MLLSNQQKYILEILKEFKYLRVRQLHALVQAHYRTQGIKIDERRMEIMLRQMRTGTNYVWLRGDVVSYGDRRIDPRLLEALDVMLELTRVQPGFYSKDGLHEPFLLRFTGNGKGAGYLFSVAWLDAAKEETIDLSIIDWDAFQIENVTPENYERVYHRVFDGWIQGFIHYCRKAPVFQRQERSFF